MRSTIREDAAAKAKETNIYREVLSGRYSLKKRLTISKTINSFAEAFGSVGCKRYWVI